MIDSKKTSHFSLDSRLNLADMLEQHCFHQPFSNITTVNGNNKRASIKASSIQGSCITPPCIVSNLAAQGRKFDPENRELPANCVSSSRRRLKLIPTVCLVTRLTGIVSGQRPKACIQDVHTHSNSLLICNAVNMQAKDAISKVHNKDSKATLGSLNGPSQVILSRKIEPTGFLD